MAVIIGISNISGSLSGRFLDSFGVRPAAFGFEDELYDMALLRDDELGTCILVETAQCELEDASIPRNNGCMNGGGGCGEKRKGGMAFL